MPKKDKKRTLSGAKDSFQTTRWTEIRQAKTNDPERRNISVNNLMSKYWKPVYKNLLRRGVRIEDAEDLTQGFFFKVVFGGELIQNADQTKGSFRNFLLKALKNYRISDHRKKTAKKQHPEQGLVSLEAVELSNTTLVNLELHIDQEYNYTWATNLLDQAFSQIEEDYRNTRNEISWQILNDTIIDSILHGVEPPSASELCKKYGFENNKKANNMKAAVKRKFNTTFRRLIREYVDDESEVDVEIDDIIKILSKGAQHE